MAFTTEVRLAGRQHRRPTGAVRLVAVAALPGSRRVHNLGAGRFRIVMAVDADFAGVRRQKAGVLGLVAQVAGCALCRYVDMFLNTVLAFRIA